MAIDHTREAAVLSYALELAASCSPPFKWDIVMAKNPQATEWIVKLIRGEFGPDDPACPG